MSTENYIHTLLPAQNPNGKHIMAAIVKRTFRFEEDGVCFPSAEQDPLLGADEYYEGKDPVIASCLKESDYIPYKVATDVVVIGKAHAPGGLAVRTMDVSVSVGDVGKSIAIFGDRTCRYSESGWPVFSEPEPFTEMEIRFENAYGGVDLRSFGPDAPMIYPRNHIGKGFVIENNKEAIEGLELPNLEDPQQLLTPESVVTGKMQEWQKQPMPQGFGWYGKLWYPRCSFAGVMPAYMSLYDEIREAAMGLVPEDHVEQFKKFKMPMLDFKFFNGAAPGFAVPFLQGNETLRLVNLDPRGVSKIQLPGAPPKIGIDIGSGVQCPEVVLHTVCILKEENKMYLVWRGAIEYPGPEKID